MPDMLLYEVTAAGVPDLLIFAKNAEEFEVIFRTHLKELNQNVAEYYNDTFKVSIANVKPGVVRWL